MRGLRWAKAATATAVDKDVSESSVMLGGRDGGVMVVVVPPLSGGSEVARRGGLRRRRAPIAGVVSALY